MISSAVWWMNNSKLLHLTPPGDRWPEGFDVLGVLRRMIPIGNTVLDFGCGDGRLANAFEPEFYVGVDVNPAAIDHCRILFPSRAFLRIEPDTPLPRVDCALAYTVLLHISDSEIDATVRRLAAAAPRVVLAEIMGRQWRNPGEPAVFNRPAPEYAQIFAKHGLHVGTLEKHPYRRYGGVDITFVEFIRYGSLRNSSGAVDKNGA